MSTLERIIRTIVAVAGVVMVSIGSGEAVHDSAWLILSCAGAVMIGFLATFAPLSDGNR